MRNTLLDAARTMVASAIVLCGLSCGNQEKASSEPTPEEAARVQAAGEAAATELATTLKSALTQAMQGGGVESAIRVCNTNALSLTDGVAEQSERIESVKRTSFKFRNPGNAPDQLETAALHYFEETQRETGKLPAFHIQKVTGGTERRFRYYQPLQAGELCLACHGEPEAIVPSVRALLKELYPGDNAVGYAAGDFRGLIRVSIITAK